MTDNESKYFQALLEIQVAESNLYWTRFLAFSAMTTGLFVLLSGTDHALMVSIAGLSTSAFWTAIQFKSLSYVKSQKPVYHELFRRLESGVEVFQNSKDSPNVSAMDSRTDGIKATSELGVIFTIANLCLWLGLLITELG